jgi:hypothetical protein
MLIQITEFKLIISTCLKVLTKQTFFILNTILMGNVLPFYVIFTFLLNLGESIFPAYMGPGSLI